MPFRPTSKSKTPPPEDTFEEAAYLKALGEKQKLVSIKLQGGEVVQGWIEYYDRDMLRLTREGAPNLFIFKSEIMYIAEGEVRAPRVRRGKAVPLKPESSDGQ
jgi:host factor-I protein